MSEVALIILIVLTIPVIAIVALVMAIGARGEVRVLAARLAALERQRAQAAAAAPTTAPSAAETPRPETRPAAVTPPPVPVTPPPPPPPTPTPVQTPSSPLPAAAMPPRVPEPTPAPTGPAISFEERFGTRWVVWVGGFALFLGGVFLVKYSIEQDLIGPGVRIFLGALLALVLIAGGEWTRRKEQFTGFQGLPTAHIPSILTAAGTAVAFADVYADRKSVV